MFDYSYLTVGDRDVVSSTIRKLTTSDKNSILSPPNVLLQQQYYD